MNNHRQLMPADDISEWSSTTDSACFNIRNMIKLSLKIAEEVPGRLLRIEAIEKPPFAIELKWELTTTADGTEVALTITATLNVMMKMVASGPLQKLADEEIMNLYNLLN
jgi:hypothetical protein